MCTGAFCVCTPCLWPPLLITCKAVHTEGGAHQRCTQKAACGHRRSHVIAVVCTALCVHRLHVYRLACGPLNNMTCGGHRQGGTTEGGEHTKGGLWPPLVCGTHRPPVCVYRLACGPFNNMTPAVATDRLLCVPPCVCTAFCVYRLACGPFNNMTPAGGHRPPFVYTALCVHRLLCVPPCLWPP